MQTFLTAISFGLNLILGYVTLNKIKPIYDIVLTPHSERTFLATFVAYNTRYYVPTVHEIRAILRGIETELPCRVANSVKYDRPNGVTYIPSHFQEIIEPELLLNQDGNQFWFFIELPEGFNLPSRLIISLSIASSRFITRYKTHVIDKKAIPVSMTMK